MDPLLVTDHLITMPKSLPTVLTLVALSTGKVELLVVLEILLCFKTPSAVSLPAEIWAENVVLAMNPHVLWMDCLVSTNSTRKLLRGCVAVLLMGEKCRGFKIFEALLTLDNFVTLLMTM